MRSRDEVSGLREEIRAIQEADDGETLDVQAMINDAGDTLDWVLGELDTEAFRSADFLGLDDLRSQLVKAGRPKREH